MRFQFMHEKPLVREYLEDNLNNRQAKKNVDFYKFIGAYWAKYPETCKELLINIPKLGYWKDYFWIMEHNKSKKLHNFIWDIITTQIRFDIGNFINDEPISTLSKWLPRENGHFDNQYHAAHILCEKLYPELWKSHRMNAMKEYRRLISNMSDSLGILEQKLCNNEDDDISIDTIGPIAFEYHKNELMKKIPNDYKKIIKKRFKKYDLWTFCYKVMKRSYTELEEDAINKIWKSQSTHFANSWDFLNYNSNDSLYEEELNNTSCDKKLFIIDLSQSIFDKFGYILLAISALNCDIIINSKNPILVELSEDIFNNKRLLESNLEWSRRLQFEKMDISRYYSNNIFVLCDRDLSKDEYQFINKFNIRPWYINCGKINVDHINKRITGSPQPYVKQTNVSKLLKRILDNSEEMSHDWEVEKRIFVTASIVGAICYGIYLL